MTPAAINSWKRSWTIVSADLDLAHVMLPLSSFRLETGSPAGKSPEFRVLHEQPPALNCFADSVLVPAGDQQPNFYDITSKEQLPVYGPDTVGEYIDVLESMGSYLMKNPGVQRLQGVIKMPCHAHSAKYSPGAPHHHAPSTVEVTVNLYQFAGAVEGGLPLLVIRAPLSSRCPMNGDGTAIGTGKN
jgi:hypothetical protein